MSVFGIQFTCYSSTRSQSTQRQHTHFFPFQLSTQLLFETMRSRNSTTTASAATAKGKEQVSATHSLYATALVSPQRSSTTNNGIRSDHSNGIVDDDQNCLASENGVNKRKADDATLPTTNTNKKLDFEMLTEIPPAVPPSYFVGNTPEWLLIRLQGGVELIYCDQGKAEAFINPVIQQLFKAGPTDKAAINIRTELQQKTGILCCVARRKSREEDEPALKHAHANAHNTYGNAQFKMTYFVRFCGQTRNTIQQRRFALETLAEVSKLQRRPITYIFLH